VIPAAALSIRRLCRDGLPRPSALLCSGRSLDRPAPTVALGDSAGAAAFPRGARAPHAGIAYGILSLVALILPLFSPPANAAIRYEVSLAHPEQHLFRVSMEVPDVQGDVKLQMAAWNALYEIRDFSSHVQQVEAYANGQRVGIEKLDKLTWQVKATGTVTVKYATFWDDVGPFNTQLNSEHAFINPAMILLYVPDRRAEKSSILLSALPADWKVASASLTRNASNQPPGTFLFEAPTYDALADDPIEASNFEEFTIHDLTPQVHVVIHGDNYKRHDVESALRKICTYEIKLMDGAPYDQYTFIFHIGKDAGGSGGGMEHSNSTAIFVPSGEYLANVSAHEYFHLWNVKRIRPVTLEPVDYTHEMYTRALWFAEGVTNTYASYALIRSGIWNKHEFYQDLASQITELEVRPAEHWQSAEESSLDAWLEKYALYNQPQRSVSYYTKGQLLGVLLDILIRDRTDNQHSLDDVMRAMNQDFAKSGKLYRDSLDVRLTAEKITGSSLEDFFTNYVSGAKPLPYSDLFLQAGLSLEQKESVRATLGFSVQREPDGTRTIASVDPGSNAEKSGLMVGDEIVRWNNADVPRRPDRWAAQQRPGEDLHLRLRRADNEQLVDLRLGELREKFYQVVEAADANDRAKRIRDGLLHGTTDPVTARNP
jgi:predicted metalloprotease with PDZ domain